jgi:hypothetical protein
MTRWYEAGVLPYLDLEFWAEENNVRIPYWLFGETIFAYKRNVDTTEAVRKTTVPYAKLLKNFMFLQTLSREAAIVRELQEAKSIHPESKSRNKLPVK